MTSLMTLVSCLAFSEASQVYRFLGFASFLACSLLPWPTQKARYLEVPAWGSGVHVPHSQPGLFHSLAMQLAFSQLSFP